MKKMAGKINTVPLKTSEAACPMCGSDVPLEVARGYDFEYDTCADEFRFVKCRACRVMYLNPRPDASELGRIYPAEYAPYHFEGRGLSLRIREYLERRRARAFARLIPGAADLLDTGCGGPGFLENLRRFGAPGWRLWGNDFNEQVIDDLERRGFGVVSGRFEEIDMPDGSFDAVFLKQVLEHLESPRDALKTAARLLRPNGLLIVETPNCDAWDAQLFHDRYWGGYHFPRHWTIFDPETLTAAAAQAGLRAESAAFMLSPSFWMQAAHHLLKDHGWPPGVYRRVNHFNPLVMGAAAALDVLQKLVRGKTSNMRMIFRKPAPEIPAQPVAKAKDTGTYGQ